MLNSRQPNIARQAGKVTVVSPEALRLPQLLTCVSSKVLSAVLYCHMSCSLFTYKSNVLRRIFGSIKEAKRPDN
jgi:hypothetical protein